MYMRTLDVLRIVPIAKYIIIWRKKTITSRQKTKGAINDKRNKITKIRKIKNSAKALHFFFGYKNLLLP